MKRNITSFVFAVILILGLVSCGPKTWQEQYDLGVRYLEDGNYEEAILAFGAAIEIDPRQADSYLGLADAYVAGGDVKMAAETLEQGYEETGSEALQDKLEELKRGLDIPFESRLDFAPFDSLTGEQQEIVQALIDAIRAQDRAAIQALEPSCPLLSIDRTVDGIQRLCTRTGEYRFACEWIDHEFYYVQFRPENGQAYHCFFAGDQLEHTNEGENIFHEVLAFHTSSCVNWQPEGAFTRYSLCVNVNGEESVYTETGMSSGGVIEGDTEEVYSNPHSSGSYTKHYEKGHMLQGDAYSEEIYIPMGFVMDGVANLSAIRWS